MTGRGLLFQVYYHQMTFLTASLWWALNLQICLWWLSTGLINLLTPLKHTESQVCEAKRYYPLSLRLNDIIYGSYVYWPFSGVQIHLHATTLPLLKDKVWDSSPFCNSNPPWDLAHLGSEAPASPASYADPFPLEGLSWATTGMFHIMAPMKHTKSQTCESKGYCPWSLRYLMPLYMLLTT